MMMINDHDHKSKNSNDHNNWKIDTVARSTLWAPPPASRSSTASVFSPSTLSTKRWVGIFFCSISSTINITHYLGWKGVSVLVVLVLRPDHPHRDAPGVQTHLYHHPTSQVLHIFIPFFPFSSIYFQVDAPSWKGQSFHPLRPGNLSTGFLTPHIISWVSISWFMKMSVSVLSPFYLVIFISEYKRCKTWESPLTIFKPETSNPGAWPLLPGRLVRAVPAVQELQLLLLQISPPLPREELQRQGDRLPFDPHHWMGLGEKVVEKHV